MAGVPGMWVGETDYPQMLHPAALAKLGYATAANVAGGGYFYQ